MFFVSTTLITLACIASDLSRPTQTAMPPEVTQIVTPSPTQIIIPTFRSEYPQATPIPAWVTRFADPILAAVTDRKPDFQDDFSQYRGWLNIMSDIYGYVPLERYDGKLFLRLPEKTKDSFLYNPKLNRSNFVLTLDLRFVHDQPEDTVRFQFNQFPDQTVIFDLSNNRNWKFQWDVQGDPQSMSGVYEHFPPEHIPVTIIMRGAQCAIFLNNDPLAYSDNCMTHPASPLNKWNVTFRLLRDTTQAVVVNFDNLKLWDLDKIPNLP